MRTVNPATGEEIAEYQLASPEEGLAKLRTAHLSFQREWRVLSVTERTEYLRKFARSLRAHVRDSAKTITEEMGKPISQSEAEVEKCAWTAEVYADNAQQWLSEESVSGSASRGYIEFQPLGVVFAIEPWNFPFWQACRSLIPALASGNTVVLRHSNQVPGCSIRLEETFRDAGFPEGVFGSIIADHAVTEELIGSPFVQAVDFSGGVDSGRKVGEVAARNLKKVVMELGGSDPFVVLEDADIAEAAREGANSRLVGGGQNCISAKRFIVIRQVAEEFVEALTHEFAQKTVGNPMDSETDVGPLSSEYQVNLLADQVADAVLRGANATMGGKRMEGKGFFFEPTILEGVVPEMKVMREEVFGPVAPIFVVEDEESAIQAANESEYGLAASIWTEDLDRGKELALRMESGIVSVNELVRSDPWMPFGGTKHSGMGRELSRYGLLEFTNIKSVNIYARSSSSSAILSSEKRHTHYKRNFSQELSPER